MNENQALVDGDKAAHHVAICSIIKCYQHAHAAGTIDRQDCAKIRVFGHNRVESVPGQERDDLIFHVIITVGLNGQLPRET